MRAFVRTSGVAVVAAAVLVPLGLASAGPVGAIPKGPVTTVTVTKGQIFAVALPHGGATAALSWRLARAVSPKVVTEVTEGDVGTNVIVVFKAAGVGKASIVYALTKGESPTAQKSSTYVVRVVAP